MKKQISLALVLLVCNVSFAGTKQTVPKKAQLGTSFKFDGSALRGKYQSSMNTAATVENDKLLEDLLKGRTQFEDRQEKEQERN